MMPLDVKVHTNCTATPILDRDVSVTTSVPTTNLGVESKEDASALTAESRMDASTELRGIAIVSVPEQQVPAPNFVISAVTAPTAIPLTALTVTAADVASDMRLPHTLEESGSAAVLGLQDHKGEPAGDNTHAQTPGLATSPSTIHSVVHVTGQHAPNVVLGYEVERKVNQCRLRWTIRRRPLTLYRSP